jgi:hypothetical protein
VLPLGRFSLFYVSITVRITVQSVRRIVTPRFITATELFFLFNCVRSRINETSWQDFVSRSTAVYSLLVCFKFWRCLQNGVHSDCCFIFLQKYKRLFRHSITMPLTSSLVGIFLPAACGCSLQRTYYTPNQVSL